MKQVKGEFTYGINIGSCYTIHNYDQMKPFFISLASDTDLWMYLSSTGGLTCGRRSPNEALFPYYTDDKITDGHEFTGPKTIIKVKGERLKEKGESLWIPFSDMQQPVYQIRRSISKTTYGNQIEFCEENRTLGLKFSYYWAPAGKHGWVRRAELENVRKEPVRIELTDMLQNVLPAGVERKTQNEFSTLVDGYKKTELVPGTSLALFRMEAILVDRAEPSEALTCNTIYTLGLPHADYTQTESKGVRANYVAKSRFTLQGRKRQAWYNVLDVSQDAVAVHELMHFIARPKAAIKQIDQAIIDSIKALLDIVGKNDGFQSTNDRANDARHFANVLFNTMRGGYYLTYPPKPEEDAEYLPLTFGRRHGDPSRPWNLFSIRVQDEKGQPVVGYQGNWRDIFQNWEALSYSYPLYTNHIIAKFLNATTADGYNPYRISDEGFEWEVIEPENPWSNIGYWGDHQIIYLLRLLEVSYKHDPDTLRGLLNERQYAFANVPYRLKSYAQIVADPKNSIWFDTELHNKIMALVPKMGKEAKWILDENNRPRRTTMADKLLITLLTKLSNFVPNAGIWMNTLRPEWNDANNALVGYGASMVTLYYMRRYVTFLQQLITDDIAIGVETADFLKAIHEAILNQHSAFGFINAVGTAGEAYRTRVYQGISGEQTKLGLTELQAFLADALKAIDASIRANKREDGLYEAYNLIKFTQNDIEISHLYEMLEGQVAVLSSGLLSPEESVELLDKMAESALYRPDQMSYMLYPNRPRKTFLELNNLPEEAKSLPVVQKYLGSILKQDCDGGIHFDAKYRNANELPDELKDLYESVFNHHAFTGRSGTFYKYEGLGCIYWHMVSKLLLAVGEVIQRSDMMTETAKRLVTHYQLIRLGIGSHKSPDQYGAFPFDAYSHTPSMSGAQQPGLTGQVKEDIISRWFELGIEVEGGQIVIHPRMINPDDFHNNKLTFSYCGVTFTYEIVNETGENLPQGIMVQENKSVLSKEDSAHIFARDGEFKEITIQICIRA